MGAERSPMASFGESLHHTRQRFLRRTVLGGSLVGAATLVVATGGGVAGASLKNQSAEAPRLVLAAYAHTVGAKTAKVTLSESVTATPTNAAPKQINITGQGSVDFKTHDAALTFSSSTGTFSDRFVTPNLYLQPPAADAAQLAPGKSWISINLNTVSEAKLGQSLAQLSSSSQQSTQTLSYLQAVSSSGISTVGPATIKGVSTTEYKATVDLTKVADQKSPTEQAAIKSVEAELHTTTLPIQVWLDGQGRVRQVSTQVQASTNAQSNGATTIPAASESATTTVDYYDFGAPVTIQAPPASQVADLTGQAIAAGSSTTTTGG
jgi:hypothetical protein